MGIHQSRFKLQFVVWNIIHFWFEFSWLPLYWDMSNGCLVLRLYINICCYFITFILVEESKGFRYQAQPNIPLQKLPRSPSLPEWIEFNTRVVNANSQQFIWYIVNLNSKWPASKSGRGARPGAFSTLLSVSNMRMMIWKCRKHCRKKKRNEVCHVTLFGLTGDENTQN